MALGRKTTKPMQKWIYLIFKGSAYLRGTNQSHSHFPGVNRHTDKTHADVRLSLFLVFPSFSLLKISALPPAAFRDKGSVTFFLSCIMA